MKKLLNKWHALPEATKSSIAFMLSSFFLTGLSVLTTPIFTRVIDKAQYGIVATYNSWLSIIDVFALLGLTSAGVFNVGLNEYKNSRDRYISSILGMCNIVTVVVFGVLFGLKSFFGDDFILPYNLLLLMFIHFVFSPANIFWITRQKYEYKYKLSTLITVFSSIVGQAFSLIVVVLSSSSELGSVRLWSSEIAMLLFYIPIYFYVIFKGKKFFDLKIWKKTLVFALPLIPHYLAQHIMASADTIMLKELVNEEAAGVYSVVYTIGKIATIVWSAINISLIAITFEALNTKEYKRLSRLTASLILGYGAVCLIVTLIAPEVLMILAPASYSAGVYVVPPIACVSFLSALYNVYANVEFYHKKPFYIAVSTIVATIVNLVLNYILIPRFSYIGAAYTTFISYVVLIIMHFIGYKKCARGEKIYNSYLIFLISAVIVGACLACNLLYINIIVRYAIIAVLGILAIIKRKSIIEKISTLLSK